jgi:hypothetical protein
VHRDAHLPPREQPRRAREPEHLDEAESAQHSQRLEGEEVRVDAGVAGGGVAAEGDEVEAGDTEGEQVEAEPAAQVVPRDPRALRHPAGRVVLRRRLVVNEEEVEDEVAEEDEVDEAVDDEDGLVPGRRGGHECHLVPARTTLHRVSGGTAARRHERCARTV